MFWNKKSEPNPLGVPLGDLMLMLQPTSIKVSLKGKRKERVFVVVPKDGEKQVHEIHLALASGLAEVEK